ncbi:hypothetical protein QYF36_011303 [Acer negundo]|nr:hypothetical protein QYF36_011303 [Acer negundo]
MIVMHPIEYDCDASDPSIDCSREPFGLNHSSTVHVLLLLRSTIPPPNSFDSSSTAIQHHPSSSSSSSIHDYTPNPFDSSSATSSSDLDSSQLEFR